MQPQNPNQNQNPDSGQPPQPGQSGPTPFQRRPIQHITPRPFAAPQAPAPKPPQQIQVNVPQSTPQQLRPQPPAQPIAPQAPKPSMGEFVSTPKPAQSQQFTHPEFRQASRPATFNHPVVPQAQPVRLDDTPLDLDLNHDSLPRFEKSRPVEAKSSLPKGVFALVAVGIATLIIGLIDKSQHNVLFNAIIAADFLLAIGLFVRKELVRKAAIGFAIATVTLSAALILSYRGLTDSTVNAEELFIAEAKKLQNQSPTKQLTHEQQQHLDAMQLKLEAQQNALGENSMLVYGKYGATVALYALAAIYLTRPKVKEAFERAIK